MLLLLFALSGPVIEPPQPPEDQPTTYYGSGQATGDADLLKRVLDKYEVIEANQSKDQAAQKQAESAKIEQTPATKPQAKAIIEAINLPPLEIPQSKQIQQARDDDQIMALIAMMLLEE